MVTELVFRFIIGGLVVSAFAVIGDVLQPKSFAGLFSAAPSVALATLGMTFISRDGTYCAIEGRSMILGAVALCLYGLVVSWLLRRGWSALAAAATSWLLWLAVAFGLWTTLLA